MKQRVRIRFAKLGDLRLIGHRDLVRAFERLFRRVGTPLAMSQGFHPRPLMTFPDALALGIAATDEVMDITLAEGVEPEMLKDRLTACSPPGLTIVSVSLLGDQDRKAKIRQTVYEMTIPAEADVQQLEAAMDRLLQSPKLSVRRKEKQSELNLSETLAGLWLEGRRLRMAIHVTQQSPLQPRDILSALGLPESIREGALLTRTNVELSP